MFLPIALPATPTASSTGLGLTEDRLCLDRDPATSVANFFPPPAALHRETKKLAAAAFHCVPALRVRVDRLRSHDPHRGRDRRGPRNRRKSTMATIGSFTKGENGSGFTGSVKTLTLNVKAKFVPTEGESERGPDYRIIAGPSVEFGAPGRKPPARPAANISPSSWTIRASPPRSTPAWSRPRTAASTTSSGPAATATETGTQGAPPSGGASSCSWPPPPFREYGDQEDRNSGFPILHILIGY